MAEVRPVEPVKLICGIISADESLMTSAVDEMTSRHGPVDLDSGLFPFDMTDYYAAEMGGNLLRKFVSFERLIDPSDIVVIKLGTNAIEKNMAGEERGVVRRRINLDPGYVTPAKLVLATTKDFAHRIYLGRSIYAEVTLQFSSRGGIRSFPWTYPDFASDRYTSFLQSVRERLLEKSKS